MLTACLQLTALPSCGQIQATVAASDIYIKISVE